MQLGSSSTAGGTIGGADDTPGGVAAVSAATTRDSTLDEMIAPRLHAARPSDGRIYGYQPSPDLQGGILGDDAPRECMAIAWVRVHPKLGSDPSGHQWTDCPGRMLETVADPRRAI